MSGPELTLFRVHPIVEPREILLEQGGEKERFDGGARLIGRREGRDRTGAALAAGCNGKELSGLRVGHEDIAARGPGLHQGRLQRRLGDRLQVRVDRQIDVPARSRRFVGTRENRVQLAAGIAPPDELTRSAAQQRVQDKLESRSTMALGGHRAEECPGEVAFGIDAGDHRLEFHRRSHATRQSVPLADPDLADRYPPRGPTRQPAALGS